MAQEKFHRLEKGDRGLAEWYAGVRARAGGRKRPIAAQPGFVHYQHRDGLVSAKLIVARRI
jgi:hypothetical protein